MSFVVWVLFGCLVGLLARAIMPGTQKMGLLPTTLLGVGGSLVGGVVASAFSHRPIMELQGTGFIGSILGALALLGIFAALNKNKPPRAPIEHRV
jgi:uncharacterized membrane protein YeaQ/YmgE (transglycosylase-associated protein family)